jgi:hypothetical protein
MFFKRLVLALTLLLPAAANAAGPGPYYYVAVQNGAFNFKGGEEQLAESYKALKGMIKLADQQNVKLTLMFTAQYAVYITTDAVRAAGLETWKKSGHEIAAYHQGPDTRAWDGYSDLSPEVLGRLRKEDRAGKVTPGYRDYAQALAGLDPYIRSACMVDSADKEFVAAAPPYEICHGLGAPKAGVNDYVRLAEGKKKKYLSTFHSADKAGIQAAQSAFAAMETGVYGAAFKSSPSEFGAFYAWLEFLRRRDPQGLRSQTVANIIDLKLMPEKERPPVNAVRGEEKRKAVPVMPKPQPIAPAVAPAESPKQEIPRLQRIPSLSGSASRVPSGKHDIITPPMRNGPLQGYCGDGICDAKERAHPGRCPRDCGH